MSFSFCRASLGDACTVATKASVHLGRRRGAASQVAATPAHSLFPPLAAVVLVPLARVRIIQMQQKNHPNGWFFVGGEGEIRTLEPSYRLHDFQSCALDQLGDFSKVALFKPLYNITYKNKNQVHNQKKYIFLKILQKHYKNVNFNDILYLNSGTIHF